MPPGSLPKSSLSKHIARLISRWPVDPVRPSSTSVQTYLQSRLDPPPPPPASPSSSYTSFFSSLFSRARTGQTEAASSSSNATSAPSQHPTEPPLLSPQNINVLYSLLENRYQNKYPLHQSLRYPRSQPEHYDVLMREFKEAPHRSWLGRVGKRLRGTLRVK